MSIINKNKCKNESFDRSRTQGLVPANRLAGITRTFQSRDYESYDLEVSAAGLGLVLVDRIFVLYLKTPLSKHGTLYGRFRYSKMLNRSNGSAIVLQSAEAKCCTS
jgi:hypothetical protein